MLGEPVVRSNDLLVVNVDMTERSISVDVCSERVVSVRVVVAAVEVVFEVNALIE